MTKFMLSTARVPILTVVLAVVGISFAIDINNAHIPDAVVSAVIKNYLEPVIKNIKINSEKSNNMKKIEDKGIVQTIDQTVNELRPRLGDNKPVKDNRPQDTQILEISETTRIRGENIKERSRPEPLEGHINKYKTLRRKIDKLLKTEAVSNKTNSLVTDTLDQMIAEMLSGQCVSNRIDYRKLIQSNSPKNKEDMVESWKSKWNQLIKQYSAATNKDPDGLEYKEMFTFLIKLREFFFEIHDELNRQNDRYKLKCNVVNSNTAKARAKKFSVVKELPILRDLPETVAQSYDDCNDIKICAEELKSFLMDFYSNLKETVDVMFKNYEAMYITDITADDDEKRSFIALLKDINTEINERVIKTFKKQTENLKLRAYNNAQEKINAIKIFLKSTVDLIERLAGKVLSLQLKSLDSKMRFTVKEDLTTSLGIELNNLNKDFSDKVCLVFQTCNGSASRRALGKWLKADPNEIFLKLRVGFPEAHMRRSGSDIRTLSDEAQDRVHNRYYQPPTERITRRKMFNARRYMETMKYNMIATRTTYPDTEKIPVSKTTVQSTTQSTTTESTTKSTTKTTTKSTTTTKKIRKIAKTTTAPKIIRRTVKSKPKPTATATQSKTVKPETTTTKITETTYTYGDYVRKMVALGKISPNPKWKKLLNEEKTTEETVKRLIGAFIY